MPPTYWANRLPARYFSPVSTATVTTVWPGPGELECANDVQAGWGASEDAFLNGFDGFDA